MSLRNALYWLYFRLQRRIVPKLRFSQDLYEEILRAHLPSSGAWLDLGCGHRLLQSWRARHEAELLQGRNVFGVDYDLDSLKAHQNIHRKARADIAALPFRDQVFELVTANMVVEHLEHPGTQFAEVCRVLKPGGRFLFHTPNLYGYTTVLARLTPEFMKKKLVRLVEGREEQDVFRTYYRANDLKTIRALAERTGFEVEQSRLIASTAALIVLFPLVIVELFWIRFLLTRAGRPLRPGLIVVLRKRQQGSLTVKGEQRHFRRSQQP